MATHDLDIANQSFPNFRSDLNNALVALGSTNSGSSAPSSPQSGMIWIDTTTATAWQPKIYDGSAWINLPFYINTTTNDSNLTTTEVTSLVPAETDPQATALAIALG
tara:strand:+ start:158 stop:478 length:321 start_codon:yes stop_codon:yes gene_type:complete